MSWVTKTMVFLMSSLNLQKLVLQVLARDRVNRPERLVHEHDRRVRGHRPGNPDALLLAAGEFGRVAVPVVVRGKADEVQKLVGALS